MEKFVLMICRLNDTEPVMAPFSEMPIFKFMPIFPNTSPTADKIIVTQVELSFLWEPSFILIQPKFREK